MYHVGSIILKLCMCVYVILHVLTLYMYVYEFVHGVLIEQRDIQMGVAVEMYINAFIILALL
jgi:hypothetical protein